jgi:UDP-3-O-[3-hydroxymyristoyl] glucosamine N-acyltransferase
MTISLQQLAHRIGAEVIGDGSVAITGCAAIELAKPHELTFLANSKYAQYLQSTKAAAVVIDRNTPCPDRLPRLIADDPYFTFRNAMIELHGFRKHPKPSTSNGASGAQSQVLGEVGQGTLVHPNVVVERGAVVGRNCVLYPGVYIGENARVGNDCLLFPNVVVYDHCVLGDRVTLHANTVIGQDGFGYATHKGAHHKIPQTGIVVVEDDVEMGAGCAIERAAVGETRIGQGSKFADLISIGHGTTIGKHCLFVSLVGVAGSVEVGNYVALGGQVGVSGHLRIGNMVQAAGQSAIVQDIPDGTKVGGVPAIEFDKAKRNALAGTELYELFKRVRSLEREMKKVSKQSPGAE